MRLQIDRYDFFRVRFFQALKCLKMRRIMESDSLGSIRLAYNSLRSPTRSSTIRDERLEQIVGLALEMDELIDTEVPHDRLPHEEEEKRERKSCESDDRKSDDDTDAPVIERPDDFLEDGHK